MKKTPLIFILLGCLHLIATAQTIQNIAPEQGLSNGQAYSIAQDYKGFIWVSTKLGIDRFDGTHIVNYVLPEDVKLRAYARIILRTDQHKILWAFTTYGEILVFSYPENKFKTIFNTGLSINDLFFDNGNKIWIAGAYSGLYQLTDTLQLKVKATYCSKIIPYKENSFVYATKDGLYCWDIKRNDSHKLVSFKNMGMNLMKSNIKSMYYDNVLSNIWIGTVENGLFCFNTQRGTLIDLKPFLKDLPSTPVWSITSYNKNTLCIGSDGGGLFFVDKKNFNCTKRIREDINAVNTIKGNGVYDVFVDQSGTIYVVTFTGGLSIIKTEKKSFQVIRHELNNVNSLTNNVVKAILEDRQKDLWFATYNGVSFWNRKTNSWKHFSGQANGQFYVFLSLAEDNNGNILAGTYSQGIYVINKQRGIIGHFNPKGNSSEKGTNYVAALLVDKLGRIWSGGYFGELSCYDRSSREYHYFNIIGANALFMKDSVTLIAAASEGAFLINTKTLKSSKVNTSGFFKKNENVSFNTIAACPKRNEIWLGSEGDGIFCWNYAQNSLKRLTKKQGLPSDIVLSLVSEQDSLVWGSTENGIFSLNPINNKIATYTIKDGLPSNSFNKQSVTFSRDKELFFGSLNGVCYFSPYKIISKKHAIKLYIDEFRIFNQPMVAGQDHSPLTTDIDQTKSLKLKYNQHSFSFSFNIIDFHNSEQISYQWKLEGLDRVWNISNNNFASYTNVQPGNYKFMLKAIDNSDGSVLDEKEISIEVSHPFWNTIPAQIILLILLIIVGRSIINYYRSKQKQKHSEEKINFFTNTAHDIKTPLSLIMAPLNELKKSTNLSLNEQYYLNLSVANLDKLSTIVNQLMEFQKSDLMKSQLLVSSFNVVSFLREKVELFKPLAEKQSVSIGFLSDTAELTVWLDRAKFERIVDNLISNAIKYSLKFGKVGVSIESSPKNWSLKVKDSGIGISKADQDKLFNQFYRAENAINSKVTGSGIGLLLTKNYVVLHHGTMHFNSQEDVGSEFIATFKLGKDFYDYSTQFMTDEESKVSEMSTNLLHPKVEVVATSEIQNAKNRTKILVVEDNDELREFLYHTLSFSYKVQVAANGLQAIEIMKNYFPDLVISDIRMPGMDGLELSKVIRNTFETSHIPIVLLTAISEKQQILEGFEIGVNDYITKPFDTDVLIAKVKTIIVNRELIKDRFLRQIETNDINSSDIPDNRDRAFLEKALNYINEHISDESLTKEVFAREMAVSSSLLYSKIKQLSGQSPSDLIRVIRLRKALELLKENKMSITEIAEQTGFNDARYFSTAFKKFFGFSPSEKNKFS